MKNVRRTDHPYATAKRSFYAIDHVDERKVHLVDDDNGSRTVTNDADNVCRELYEQYGNVRIFYLGTDDVECELVHEQGVFKDYKFAPDWRSV